MMPTLIISAIIVLLLVAGLVYSLCRTSGDSDDAAVRQYRDLVERKQKREEGQDERADGETSP